jgi:hypothetical protein
MSIERTIRILLSLALALCAVRSRPALAGQIVGITFGSGLYNVDPSTGSTTLLRAPGVPGCGPYLGASGSPHAGTILDSSIVNVHETNVTTFQTQLSAASPTLSIWPLTGAQTHFTTPVAPRCSPSIAPPRPTYVRKRRWDLHSQPVTCRLWDLCPAPGYMASAITFYISLTIQPERQLPSELPACQIRRRESRISPTMRGLED